MANFFETLMIVCFGVSWPASIAKSYRARTTQGKSLLFLCLLALGYICGITAKLISHTYNCIGAIAIWKRKQKNTGGLDERSGVFY